MLSNIPQPGIDFNLLTNTSAMSCKSWSVPAGPVYCAGFTAGDESPCRFCYAAGGRYNMPNVKDTQQARWEWWRNTPTEDRVKVLVRAINALRNGFFRVYDSGDFSNISDVEIWAEIASKCPKIKFWFPTRSWYKPEFTEALIKLNSLPNVVIRRSALRFNLPADSHPIITTSEVHTTGEGCPKQTHGSCAAAGCRACWSKDVPLVKYLLHGHEIDWAKRIKKTA